LPHAAPRNTADAVGWKARIALAIIRAYGGVPEASPRVAADVVVDGQANAERRSPSSRTVL
jgi:hypothetical protein